MPLPPLPPIELDLVEELSASDHPTYLTVLRHRFRVRLADGSHSDPFVYDTVVRNALDAVVIVAHFQYQGASHVYLRSALRPPLLLRPTPSVPAIPIVWELPAGLIEPEEQEIPEGPKLAARRELEEELGFSVPTERLLPLGPPVFSSPGLTPERLLFFEVEVDPKEQTEPTLDGSCLEQHAMVASLPLEEALQLCARGLIEDGKTELGLRRLQHRSR